jgi:hypothetical protein
MKCALSTQRVKTLTFAGMTSVSSAETNGAEVLGKFGVSTIETNPFTHWARSVTEGRALTQRHPVLISFH